MRDDLLEDLAWEHLKDLAGEVADIDQAEADAEDTQLIIDQLRRQ